LLQLAPLSRRYAMQLVNPLNYISAKAMSVSVSLLLNVYQVFATLSLLVQR
jgi:hypothetical protein